MNKLDEENANNFRIFKVKPTLRIMSLFKLITIFFLFCSSLSFGQNRVFERPGIPGRGFYMDRGSGHFLLAREIRFGAGLDSSHVVLMGANPDMELTSIGGFAIEASLTWLNGAASVHDGAILVGSNLGSLDKPYVLRMDTLGNIVYSSYFNNLQDGQFQIKDVRIDGDNLSVATWASNTRRSFYMFNGTIDGNFDSGLRVHAPDDIEFRTSDFLTTENIDEQYVICQADTNQSQHKFIVVMKLNADSVVWAQIHDHGATMNSELEQGYNGIRLSDGNWLYVAMYRGESTYLEQRIVKMDGDGNTLWSKEYFVDDVKVGIGAVYETEDEGLLMSGGATESLIIKLDADGEVLWSKRYVPTLSEVSPLGLFQKNSQNQLYSINGFVIAETDEEFNICDMEPHSGVTDLDVSFDITHLDLNSTQIEPDVQEMPVSMRTASFNNSLSCLATGIEEGKADEIKIYPNPASDILNMDLSNFQNEVNLSVIDMQGRVVMTKTSIAQNTLSLDVAHLKSGVCLLRIESGVEMVRTRFVKH